MPYIALKPIRFDRPYFIGETIPDEAVAPARAGDLAAMGLIAAVKAPQEPAQAAEEAAGVNGPAEPETAAGEPQEPAQAAKKRSAKK